MITWGSIEKFPMALGRRMLHFAGVSRRQVRRYADWAEFLGLWHDADNGCGSYLVVWTEQMRCR